MLTNSTITKLHEMRLRAMADAFREQTQSPAYASLSFEERFGLAVDAEWTRQKSNQLSRLLRKATLRYPSACVEDIEYHVDRRLEQAQMLRLATCAYIHEKLNIILMGASGAGKTFIGCALGNAACRHLYATKYIRLPELLTGLAIARGDGTYKKVIAHYKKVSLLIIDEWLLVPLAITE